MDESVLVSGNADSWLRYAEEDLKAAELLFKSGFHRHALFWVEQASEKIFKVFIIDVLGAKNFVSVIDYYMKLAESDEDREMLKKMRKKLAKLSDPKSYQHLCKEKDINMVILFFDMLLKAPLLSRMSKILRELSDIRKKMSKERYKRAFREAEKPISKAVSSIQIPPITSCREIDASYIVQMLRSFEEHEDKVKEAILDVAQKELQKYGGDEVAEEAVKDACRLYTFLSSLTVPLYLMLHMYLCQFFEATRYPEGKIPRDIIENMPQIINLLRKNLERVRRLASVLSLKI